MNDLEHKAPAPRRRAGRPARLLAALAIAAGSANGASIDPWLAERLDRDGSTDFFVVLAEQADLGAAARQTTKAAKGRYVLEALRRRADASQQALRAQLSAAGVEYRPFHIANAIYVARGDRALAERLAASAGVAALLPNGTMHLDEPPVDAADAAEAPRGIASNLAFVHADQAWALGVEGDGIVIGSIDTGLDWQHPAILQQYRGWNGVSADHAHHWWDATGTYPAAPGDGHGHGTHTTGTLVGDDGRGDRIGVAPQARTIHCKGMSDAGSGSDLAFLTCFEFMLAPWNLAGADPRPDLAPDILNNSWGYPGGQQPLFRQAVSALRAAGILVEVSAGNDGPNCGSLGSPGDYPDVLTTGSVGLGAGLPGLLTRGSSRGPSALAAGVYRPGVMAPGEAIRSAIPGGSYTRLSGTSMAGPHVSAAAGLMWQAQPALRGDVARTEQLIYATAVPLTGQTGSSCGGDYGTGPNHDWGHGTLDALAAVQAAIAIGGPTGTLQGTVRDAASGAPLAQASIALGPFVVRTDDSGAYRLTPNAGVYAATATRTGYAAQTVEDANVAADATTTLDFALDGAQLSASPAAFDATVAPGTIARRSLTLTNAGPAPAEFAIRIDGHGAPRTAGVSIPRYTGTLAPSSEAPSTAAPPPGTRPAAGAAEAAFDWPPTGARAIGLNVYPQQRLVEIPDIDRPGQWNVLANLTGAPYAGDFRGHDFTRLYTLDYNDNALRTIDVATGARTTIGVATPLGNWTGLSSTPDGRLYAVSTGTGAHGFESTLYTIDPLTAAATRIGNTRAALAIIDIAFAPDGTLYAVDIVSDALYTLDPATAEATWVGALGVDANFSQGIAFHHASGVLYWAAYVGGGGQLRVIDTTTGASAPIGAFPDDVLVGVLAFENDGAGPWVTAHPPRGQVPAGGSATVELRFDARLADPPGPYTAVLEVGGAFAAGPAPLPLTMRIGCEACGHAGGQVTDARQGFAVTATIRLDDGQTVFESTGSTFAIDLPAGSYTASVAAPGYFTQTRTVAVAAGGAVVADFALLREEALLAYDPAQIVQPLDIGQQGEAIVEVRNAGTVPLQFRARVGALEGPRRVPPMQAVDTAAFSAPAAIGPASLLGAGTAAAAAAAGGWLAATALPAGLARYGHAQCPGDPDRYYVVGGIENGDYSRAVRRYDAATDAWTTLAPLPSQAGGGEGIAVTCHDGYLYAAGGDGTNRFLIYDIAADAWSAGPALPRGVWGAAIGAYDGRIHVAGGAPGFAFGDVSRAVEVFDIASGSWSSGTPMPVGTAAAGYAQVGRHLYVVGGWGVGSPAANIDRTQRYDLVTGTWETGPAFVSARADFALAATATRLYAIGGDGSGGDLYEPSGRVESLDHLAWPLGEWRDLGTPLTPLTAFGGGYCTQAVSGGEVWAVGGVDAGLAFLSANRYRPAEACFAETPWLRVDEREHLLGAGESMPLTLAFDARHLQQPGTYTAQLRFISNAAEPVAPLPVTMQLACSSCGRLSGTIRDAESGGPVVASLRATPAGGSATAVTGSDYALDRPAGPYRLDVAAPGYADATATVTLSAGAEVVTDFALLRRTSTASYTPTAIDASLPAGAADERTVTVTNTGTEPLALALSVGGYAGPLATSTMATEAAAGHGEWRYRDAHGMPAPNGTARMYPGAYRWTPQAQPDGAPRVLIYADDVVHRAPDTYLDRALRLLGWGYTAHYDGDFPGFVAALTGQPWDLVLVGHETMPLAPNVPVALDAYVRGGGRLVIHSNGIDAAPLWTTLGVADFTTIYDPPAAVHWWEPTHGVFNRPQSVPALLAPAGGIYAINGYRFTAAPGVAAVAGYTASGAAAGEAALLIGNDGRSVLKGFNDGSHSADLDGDGLPDAAELWVNLIAGSAAGYGAGWASVTPAQLSVPAGGSASFTVRIDSAELTEPGRYTASVRLAGPLTLPALPLTLDLRCAGCSSGSADLGLSGLALPPSAEIGGSAHLLATVGNFGPDAAEAATVTFELPPVLGFVAGRWIDGVPRGAGDWACTPTGSTVRCMLSGASLPVHAFAAMLDVEVRVRGDTRPGPVETLLEVTSAQDDPNPANDRATLRLMLDYADGERVFADGFEAGTEANGQAQSMRGDSAR
ncbi:MAG TPA: S8 family serine peptidase [Dokdonella sp.]|uniref:S8 family serine peptidase n=1 Tax=Dokdonella sp. TaxID=2291710 RepID=UPI002CA25661|nr:S8 family serine peptidase [Dokdonella sp.]HUD42548.1 S8 family serine peptidase [Dokdonella sp.]